MTMPIGAMIAPVRALQQNCTIVWCTKTMKAAIIDPGGEVDRLVKALAEKGLTLEKIWITHG
ncbi:MBL fold metallo-hydrolase, partial [Bradyrhizobium canariense]|uniref:MBL fold metallo-hydrolase n=1 Tax=Bradyrhizobium canariense TaxID=255045 RepID=UPI000A2512EA